jgi:hypothetical protein
MKILVAILVIGFSVSGKADTALVPPFDLACTLQDKSFGILADTTTADQAGKSFTALTISNPAGSGVNMCLSKAGVSCLSPTSLEIMVGNTTSPTGMSAGSVYSTKSDTTVTSQAVTTWCLDGGSTTVREGHRA